MLSLIISTISTGVLFSFVAMGVFISYRIFKIPDMTTDGSFLTGAAVGAVLLINGVNPVWATLVAGAAGMVTGFITGILHTRFRIDVIIAGIIVTSAVYSINLAIMEKPFLPTSQAYTLYSIAEDVTPSLLGTDRLFGLPAELFTELFAALFTAFFVAFLLRAFFKTHLGMAMRAAGDNKDMITPLGVNVGTMLILGLSIANGLVAVSGMLFVQAGGFVSLDIGVGQLVGGLGSVLVGRELMRRRSFGWGIIGAVVGSVIYQLVIALVFLIGDFQVWMRLATALFLLGVLLLPERLRMLRASSRTNSTGAQV